MAPRGRTPVEPEVEISASGLSRHRTTEYRAYQRSYRQQPEAKRLHAERSAARRARRTTVLAEVKLTAGCADCGYREHSAALQFDHLPQFEKVANLSAPRFRMGPWPAIWEEVMKCEVVCANCHAIRTVGRRNAVA